FKFARQYYCSIKHYIMNSIFDHEGNRKLIDRIHTLTPISLNEWGTMNVSQMLVHCQMPIKVAFGELYLKGGIIAFLFGKAAKKQMLREAPFKKNLPTAKEFTVKGHPDFEESKKILIQMIEKFKEGPAVIKNKKHPFFGNLTDAEWDHMQWKHLDHHLKQFGA
ncbi:MAG TPA: DUF1569 domain-containing protein, partial [Flavobacterium sp.]|nr:DUF1569 domain-containing protein [Flavobacterium sp.]